MTEQTTTCNKKYESHRHNFKLKKARHSIYLKFKNKPRESMETLVWWHSGRKRAYMHGAPVVLVIFQFLISCFCVFNV